MTSRASRGRGRSGRGQADRDKWRTPRETRGGTRGAIALPARYISRGRVPNGHAEEGGRMVSRRSRFRGNREWKEGALVGPSLPLIVRAVSRSSPFRALPRARKGTFSARLNSPGDIPARGWRKEVCPGNVTV